MKKFSKMNNTLLNQDNIISAVAQFLFELKNLQNLDKIIQFSCSASKMALKSIIS